MIQIELMSLANRREMVSRYQLTIDAKPKITENDFVGLLLTTNIPLVGGELVWLSELSFEPNYLGVNGSGLHVYECLADFETEDENRHRLSVGEKAAKWDVNLVKVFLNNFGLCEVYFEATTSNSERVKVGEFDVLSTKIRTNELNDIFDFLFEQDVSYWEPFSPIRSKESNDQAERLHLFWLLKSVQRDLSLFNDLSNLFRADPRTRLIPAHEVVTYTGVADITERSLEWLLENTDTLQHTNQPYAESIRLKNRYYNINTIETEFLVESSDVYENRILHGYLYDVINFISEQSDSIQQRITILQSDEATNPGSVSLVVKQRLRYFERLVRDCKQIIQLGDRLIKLLQEVVPVTQVLIEFPTVIEGFEVKEHYRQLLHPIRNWFSRDRSLAYGDHQLFVGTRSFDKLYELFCLFKLIEGLESLQFKLRQAPANEVSATSSVDDTDGDRTGVYYFTSHENVHLRLYYECLPPTLTTIIYTKHWRELKPDFVIEWRRQGDVSHSYIILDAKYQNVNSIRKYTYRDLIPKYLHGVGKVGGGENNITGLFILHPMDENSPALYESWFKRPNGLMDTNPAMPTIGRISIPIAKNHPNNFVKVISRLFALIGAPSS